MPLYPRSDLHAEGLDERPDIPSRVRRWPDRVRCYKCRNFFDFIVVDRLYCSYACAGREAPHPEPRSLGKPGDHVPRQCKLQGGKRFKRRYRSLEIARDAMALREEPGLNCYYCNYCNYWHIGHESWLARMAEEREARNAASAAKREALRKIREGNRKAQRAKESNERERKLAEAEHERKLELRRRAITERRKLKRSNNGVIAPWATRNS